MPTFSQRIGLKPVRSAFQVDSLDEETRNALWNVMVPFLQQVQYRENVTVGRDIWTGLFHQAADTVPATRHRGEYDSILDGELFVRYFRSVIIERNWNECLDLIEFMVDEKRRTKWNNQFYNVIIGRYEAVAPTAEDFNAVFKQYLVSYRFVDGVLTPITDNNEVLAIEKALDNSEPSVRELLEKALGFLSDRTSPDYAKSVDCSISAVESQCRILLGGAPTTLGQALKQLEKKGVGLHPALKDAFDKLYGYTSNADGIRHGGINPADVDQALAQFMLVSCSAFVNYLISKGIDNINRK